METPDTSNWLTLAQAATALEVSERTLHRMADSDQLVWERRKVPGEKEARVFDPASVNALRAKKGLPPVADSGSQGQALAPPAQLEQFALAVVKAARQDAEPEPEEDQGLPLSELRFKVYLTTAEAVRPSGLSAERLRELVKEGKISRDGTRKYRRVDLEKL